MPISAARFGTLMQLLRGQRRHGDHAGRLQAFYAPQADGYDDFRERLLHGRQELVAGLLANLAQTNRPILAELGAGTGKNLDYIGREVARFKRIDLVDLCPALLAIARRRAASLANVKVIEADVRRYRPAAALDAVLCSYSLSMMPEWREVLDLALALLKPGGTMAVVDFTVTAGQSRFARRFWQAWFGHDGVRLSPEHLALLRRHFPEHRYQERRCAVPYLPGLTVPYYLFIGRKTAGNA